jgi:hypothetical protein
MREILKGYTLNSGKVYMIRLYLGIQLDIYFKPKQISMKKVILILAVMLSSVVNAQLEVNENVEDSVIFERTGMAALSPLGVNVLSTGTHVIFFKNSEYTQITVIESLIIGTSENLKQMMELLLKSCESLYNISRYSKRTARIVTPDGSFYMTTKEAQQVLDKL